MVKHFRQVAKKIIAAGKNYKTVNMPNSEFPPVPLLFLKPASSFINSGESIKVPDGCKDLQHEVELGVVIGKKMDKTSNGNAMDYVAGYTLALDMTANDFLVANLEKSARENGNPWFISKGFDSSCPVSDLLSKNQLKDPHNVDIWCSVNGELKQKENTSMMIFDIPQLLRYASKYVTLEPGDVLLTGTPSGISTVKSGDQIECGLGDVVTMKFRVE